MQRLDVSPQLLSVEPQLSREELQQAPSIEAAIELVTARYDFSRHPYFLWMAKDSTKRDDFRRTQVPFRFAVEAFPQALAAVLARMPRLETRQPIADNIAEEHGRGNLLVSHKATFLQYLRAMGAQPAELERSCPTTVRAFNQSLLGFCLMHGPEAGAALLGVIEHLYVGISTQIAGTVGERGWCAAGSQRHYEVHQVLDETHSRDLFDVARPLWPERSAREQVALGLTLGAHWFWTLYLDLHAAR